jgi:hypothetical protein
MTAPRQRRPAPQPPAMPTRPSPGIIEISPDTAPRTATLPDAGSVVSGGTTADGVPFLVRTIDGDTVELAAGTAKPRTATKVAPDAAAFREIGSAAPSPFTSALRQDPVAELRGVNGLRVYRNMKRSSSAVRGSLRAVKTPIESARWFVEPGADTPIAKKQAEFVAENLFNGLDVTWAQTLSDILTFLEYGHSILQKVYVRETGLGGGQRILLAKLAPRHPLDVDRFEYDQFGSPSKVWFHASGAYETRSDGGAYPLGNPTGQQGIPVEIGKLVVFTLDGEAGDLAGTSVLRSSYGNWLIQTALMKIDAVQKERHSLGIPVITLPPGAGGPEMRLAEEMGRNLRANERAHVVLPGPTWKIEWAKLEGQPVDPRDSMSWHNEQIYRNVLFGGLGDREPGESEHDLFMKSTRYIADRIADTLNRWVVRELIDFNWASTKSGTYPRVRARWIGEFEDQRTRSFAIRNLVGAGLITPDEPLESALRRELDLPLPDLTTRRITPTPQVPGQEDSGQGTPPESNGGNPAERDGGSTGKQRRGAVAGAPRQGKPSTGRQEANAGVDRSGGK